MRIGKFSQATGLSINTLRYYDKIGLLTPEKNNQQRSYSKTDLKRAREIIKLKTMNFSLSEMKRLFVLDQEMEKGIKTGIISNEVAQAGLDLLELKYQEIIRRELQLKEIKKQLQHLIGKMKEFIQKGVSEHE